MTDARAGVDVVVPERGANELLHRGTSPRSCSVTSDAADGTPAVFRLDPPDLGGGVGERLGHETTRQAPHARADHRRRDAVAMCGIAPREATPSRTVAVVRAAVLVRHHAGTFRPSPRRGTSSRRRNTRNVVFTTWVGWPLCSIDFSVSVAVGHAWTQRRRRTHSDEEVGAAPVAIFESKPRPRR